MNTFTSEVIKAKIAQYGGSVDVTSINGKVYNIRSHPDGKSFVCDQLPINPPYEYRVFDVITDMLHKQGGKARKGNGRNKGVRLGEKNCDDKTVVGIIAKNYAGKKDGESVFDPVFVLVSVLEWAGIAVNKRGYIELAKKNNQLLPNRE